MKVPFLDLKAHHAPLIDEFDRAIREVIESSAFAGGPFVERFEEEFAAYCGSEIRHRRWQWHRCALAYSAGAGDRAGRRSDHGSEHIHSYSRGHYLLQRSAGVRRCGRKHVHNEPG